MSGLVLPVVVVPAAQAATPSTLYVATTGTDSGACTTLATACRTLQYAITQAQTNDAGDAGTILVGPGTYLEDDSINASALASLTIKPSFGAVTVDGGGLGTPFSIFSGTVALQNLAITHGSSTQAGGGIADYSDAPLTLTADVITGNTSTSGGGGVYVEGTGNATVTATVIINNITGGPGGGLQFNSSGKATVTASTVNNNTSHVFGGGIASNDGGNVTVSASTLRGNIITSGRIGGGGIYNDGTVNLIADNIAGNTGHNGGGIYNDTGAIAAVSLSRITGNTATSDGGGIYNNAGGTATVSVSTITSNSATSFGGGIYTVGASTTLTVTHVTGNTPNNCTPAIGLCS